MESAVSSPSGLVAPPPEGFSAFWLLQIASIRAVEHFCWSLIHPYFTDLSSFH